MNEINYMWHEGLFSVTLKCTQPPNQRTNTPLIQITQTKMIARSHHGHLTVGPCGPTTWQSSELPNGDTCRRSSNDDAQGPKPDALEGWRTLKIQEFRWLTWQKSAKRGGVAVVVVRGMAHSAYYTIDYRAAFVTTARALAD